MFYTIDTDFNVTALDETGEPIAGRDDQIGFRTLAELASATAFWPAQAFVYCWNGFAGVPPFGDLRPVKKFENATIARKRIFAAIEKGFGPTDATHCATTPAAATITQESDMRTTTKKKRTAKAAGAKHAKKQTTKVKRAGAAVAPPAAEPVAAKAGSRKETILGLIGRKKGATLGELMEATGWQKHSVRGFIATLHTKGGVEIASSKNAAGERVYQGAAA